MVALAVYQINPNTESKRNEKKNIWSDENFHEQKLFLKYLWRSKAVKVYNLENKHS